MSQLAPESAPPPTAQSKRYQVCPIKQEEPLQDVRSSVSGNEATEKKHKGSSTTVKCETQKNSIEGKSRLESNDNSPDTVIVVLFDGRAVTIEIDQLNKKPGQIVDILTGPGIATLLPVKSRIEVVGWLFKLGHFGSALDLVKKSMSRKSRPAGEENVLVPFFQFLCMGIISGLEKLFVGPNEPNSAVYRDVQDLLSKLEEMCGGGKECSRILLTGISGIDEEMTLPFQSATLKKTPIPLHFAFDKKKLADVFMSHAVNIVALLNVLFFLAQISALATQEDENPVNDRSKFNTLIEQCRVLTGLVKRGSQSASNCPLGFEWIQAALASIEGNWRAVLDACKVNDRHRRKRRLPPLLGADLFERKLLYMTSQESLLASDLLSFYSGHPVDTGKSLIDNDIRYVTDRALLATDRNIARNVQAHLINTVAGRLVLADELFVAGAVAQSESEFRRAEGKIRKTEKADVGLNKRAILAETLYQSGRFEHVLHANLDKAEEGYRAALTLNPNHHAARYQLAKCLSVKNIGQSNSQLNALQKIFPWFIEVQKKLNVANEEIQTEGYDHATIAQTVTKYSSEVDQQSSEGEIENMILTHAKMLVLCEALLLGHEEAAEPGYRCAVQLCNIAADLGGTDPILTPTQNGKVVLSPTTNETSLETLKDEDQDSGHEPSLHVQYELESERSDFVKKCDNIMKRKSMPPVFFNRLILLMMASRRHREVLDLIRAMQHHSFYQAKAPEALEICRLTAMYVGGMFEALHSRLKKLAASPSSGRICARKDFIVLRALSYLARNDQSTARQILEKALSNLHSEVTSSGGRNMELWESYCQIVELAYLCRGGISNNPFQDKSKELLERCMKKESKRLSDDPSASTMPVALKSRLFTLLAWTCNQRGLKKKIQERRQGTSSMGGDELRSSNSSKQLLLEARNHAREAVRLDPSNWRAAVLIGQISRELHQTAAASKIFQLIAGSFGRTCNSRDRAQLDLILARESAYSLAAVKVATQTVHAKFQKAVVAALELNSNDSTFLISLAESIVDPSTAELLVPALVAQSNHNYEDHQLLLLNSLTHVRAMAFISKTKKTGRLRDIDFLQPLIEEATLLVELHERLLREKRRSKDYYKTLENGKAGVPQSPKSNEKPTTIADVVANEFPIFGLASWKPYLSTTSDTVQLPVIGQNEGFVQAMMKIATLRELERLPKDEVIEKRLKENILPILTKLQNIEPLVRAECEREREAKNQLITQNDKARQDQELQKKLEAEERSRVEQVRDEELASELRRAAEDMAASLKLSTESDKKRKGVPDDFIDDTPILPDEEGQDNYTAFLGQDQMF